MGVLILPKTPANEIRAYAFKFFWNGQWYGDWVETERPLTTEEEIAAKATMLDLADKMASKLDAHGQIDIIWWKGHPRDIKGFLRPE